ncbi:sterol desaturase family protein [uncultured Massilia sp.]|uniref:sterol desaturase family protein n=1 Tax=uncultured Massilia sp. TaxID=169973 RepID=UPI0025CC38BA|nr:sterol desaturase family protein [uncultured Massilia sp.]
MEYLTLAWHGILDYGWRILYASMLFFVLELLIGHNKYSMASRLRGAAFWVVYIAITVASMTAFNALWADLGIQPLVSLSMAGLSQSSSKVLNVVGWIVTPVVAVIVGEFFYYWFHRAQHSNRILWAFHAEHHALREMSAWNSNHHFTEEILRIPFVIIPSSLLIHLDPGFAPAIVWLLIGVQGQYIHSHTRLNLGPLRYVVADNRFHRIHHSVEREHWNTNFGSFTSVWDIVFRTARFPRKDEWPDTGIDEHDEAKTLREFLFRPFTKLRGKA